MGGLICCCWLIVAEADVRVRVRGRVVSVHRQRGQVRVVSVVATAETTNRRISAAALSFCERTQPHHLTGTPILLCALVGGMDFCFNDVAPHLHTMRAKFRLGFTAKKSRPSPSLEMTSIFEFSAPTALRRYGCLRYRSAGAAEPRSFRFRARFARGFTFSTPLYGNRCRSRRTRSGTRARRARTPTTGTGTSR